MPGNDTILLDVLNWDLVVDVHGNIAQAALPYSLAQDAASAIKTFQGEAYWDTSIGVPYLSQVFGKSPPLTLVKALFAAEALTVLGVGAATCYISGIQGRGIAGQVQVTAKSDGQTAVANFQVINPQGGG